MLKRLPEPHFLPRDRRLRQADHGVGDFGVAGNDKWNYRFNLNLGYYY